MSLLSQYKCDEIILIRINKLSLTLTLIKWRDKSCCNRIPEQFYYIRNTFENKIT